MVHYIDYCYNLAFLTFKLKLLHQLLIFSLDPAKPQLYYISIGLKGLSFIRRCFHDEMFSNTSAIIAAEFVYCTDCGKIIKYFASTDGSVKLYAISIVKW